MLSTRDPPQNRGHIQTESEGLEKVFHANGDQKKAGVAILISDKIDFLKNFLPFQCLQKISTFKRVKKEEILTLKLSRNLQYIFPL